MVSDFIEKTEVLKSKLIDLMLLRSESASLVTFIGRHQFNLTGWSLFEINKSLLVSFVGAIGTFSILFANLSGARI